MSSFTFEEPDPGDFLAALRAMLRSEGEDELLQLLSGATCSISGSSHNSRGGRWEAVCTTVYFQVPPERLSRVSDGTKKPLMGYCDRIMPPETGLDVTHVDFVPKIGGTGVQQNLAEEVGQISDALSSATYDVNLPADLLLKSQEMAQVYLYLYIVENALRLFIESVASEKSDTADLSQLAIPANVRNRIASRKQNEEKNKWMSVRGGSDLFYVDFKELADIVTNNWTIFGSYFPDQAWIKTKVEEMANCRNLIAHNSYVDDHDRDVIRTNFRSILLQIGAHAHDRERSRG
jgi:hypothetical protein